MKKKLRLIIDSLVNRESSLGNIGYYLTENFRNHPDFDTTLSPWENSNIPDKFTSIVDKHKTEEEIDVMIRKCDPHSAFPDRKLESILFIAYVYYDSKTLDKAVIDKINERTDVLAVPSEFTKKRFEGFGVTIPIEVVPLGVDTEVFKDLEIKPKDKFRFITYGEQGERKGTDILMKAFKEEFGENKDVELRIISSMKSMGEVCDHLELSDNMKVIQGPFPIEELVQKINECHCYVSATREDSFGMCGLESMACGLLVIAPKNTGYTQYVNDSNGYLVESQQIEDNKYEHEPDIKYVKSALRSIYIDWDRTKIDPETGIIVEGYVQDWNNRCESAKNTANTLSWNNLCNNFDKIIKKYSKVEKVELPIQKTKILAYGDNPFCMTGFGRVAKEVLTGLNETGKYDITVFALNYREERDKYGKVIQEETPFRVLDCAYNTGDMFGKDNLCRFMDENEFDIFWTVQDLYNIQGQILDKLMDLRKQGRKFKIMHYFPVDSSFVDEELLLEECRVDYPIPYTQFAKDVIGEKLGNKAHCFVDPIPHGTNMKEFYPFKPEVRDKYREQNNFKGKFVILNVNRNQPRKDLTRSIAVFAEVKKKIENAVLILHCDPHDTGGHLLNILKYYGLKENKDVYFNSQMNNSSLNGKGISNSELNILYNLCDVMITTSLGEGWGLSTTEAMACKLPVVCPNNTVFPEILDNGERGFLCKSGETKSMWKHPDHFRDEPPRPITDIDDMVEKVYLVFSNKDITNRLVERAYEYVRENSWKKIVEKHWIPLFELASKK